MTPSIRIVHVLVDPRNNNGSDVAPAVITRVWSGEPGGAVNVRVLHDGPSVPPDQIRQDWLTSVPLYESREDADAAHAGMWEHVPEESRPAFVFGAFWPPRV